MTARRTAEQLHATRALDAVAGLYRTTVDLEGWPIAAGRYGALEHDDRALTVYTDRPRLHGRLLAIPGVTRSQRGDTELRALVDPSAVQAVALVIRARRRRTMTPAEASALGAKTAYKTTSRRQERATTTNPTGDPTP